MDTATNSSPVRVAVAVAAATAVAKRGQARRRIGGRHLSASRSSRCTYLAWRVTQRGRRRAGV